MRPHVVKAGSVVITVVALGTASWSLSECESGSVYPALAFLSVSGIVLLALGFRPQSGAALSFSRLCVLLCLSFILGAVANFSVLELRTCAPVYHWVPGLALPFCMLAAVMYECWRYIQKAEADASAEAVDLERQEQAEAETEEEEEALKTKKGVSPQQLEQLRVIFATDSEGAEKASEEGCSICLNAFSSGERLLVPHNCSHRFHSDCLTPWLERNSTCPMCRRAVLPEEEPEVTNTAAEDGETRDVVIAVAPTE